jgi:hypothetical protein
MQSIIGMIVLLIGIISVPAPGHSAPAMAHAECRVTGSVLSVTERSVERDASWAQSWGIPRRITYTDVVVRIASSDMHQAIGFNNCADKIGDHTFQLHENWQNWTKRWQLGDCITALSRFGGDEFRIGDWLYDIAETKPVDCED